ELAIDVVRVPVAEPTHALLDGGVDRFFEPHGLALFGEFFDAGVEFAGKDGLVVRTREGANQGGHPGEQLDAGGIHGATVFRRAGPERIAVHYWEARGGESLG